jgi:hypothetical protein
MIGCLTVIEFYSTNVFSILRTLGYPEDRMGWKKRFLELMMQQTKAIERLCTMQHVMIQHMQHLLMLQDVMPQKLILPDSFTHPLFHAFEEIDVSTIPACPEGKTPGHVYLLVAENGWCKIGMSRNVKARVKHLKIQLPFRTKVLHAIPTDDVISAEMWLQRIFEDCRLVPSAALRRKAFDDKYYEYWNDNISAIGTEWFRLSAASVVWIKSIPEMLTPEVDENGERRWKAPEISKPDLGLDDEAYKAAHYGWFNGRKRRRIELLEEYDVDEFGCRWWWNQPITNQESHPVPPPNKVRRLHWLLRFIKPQD